ncbi:MAG: hypothetical protein EOP00_10715 [Pedobacter sp.]|nr:MAG: hypothetical protein EOP00_10715 [Pedobacter sp.]
MKKIKSLLLLLLITSFGISSCQKDIVFVDGSGPGGTAPTTYTTKMSAKVDGILVNCEFAYAQEYVNPDGKKDLQINGIKNPQAFTFTWQDFKGVGTYNAADLMSFANYTAGITDPLVDGYFAESGTIKITTYNTKVIIGTFEFKAANTNGAVKTITEGQFVISLAPISAPTPGTTTTNITAKVDGAVVGFAGQAAYVKSTIIGNVMTIVGTNGVKAITIAIYNFKGSGTYEIDVDAQGGYNEDQSQTGSYATESGVKTGKLIITSSTANTIKGTFEFTAPNMDTFLTTKKVITEGKFDLSYTTTTI